MRLFELANNPYPFVISKSNGEYLEHSFKTEAGTKYLVGLSTIGREGEQRIEIDFSVLQSSGHTTSLQTNTGDAYRVFATVKAVLDSYFHSSQRFNPEGIEYIEMRADTDEPSRIKLYNRMMPKLVIPGFELDEPFQSGQYIMYRWSPV